MVTILAGTFMCIVQTIMTASEAEDSLDKQAEAIPAPEGRRTFPRRELEVFFCRGRASNIQPATFATWH